jgi:D-alanine-D-alanine ligase
MIKVGVIFGGETVEHEISIITAVQAMSFIDTTKYEVVPIYISKDRNWYTGELLKDMSSYKNLADIPLVAKEVTLTKKDDKFILQKKRGLFKGIANTIDVAFPIVHGTNCEDGTMAGFLTLLGIPFVGPDILASSIGMDKILQKKVLKESNIPVVDFVAFYSMEYIKEEEKILADIEAKLEYPVIVKPGNLGSSVRIKKAKNKVELEEAIEFAFAAVGGLK